MERGWISASHDRWHRSVDPHMTSLADQIAPDLVPSIILDMLPLQDPLYGPHGSQPDVDEIVLHAL